MDNNAIPQTEDQLLNELRSSDCPVEYLSGLFDIANQKEDLRLRQMLKRLSNQGCIHIPIWADNKPYYVELFDSGACPEFKKSLFTSNDSHDIIIGDNATISRSAIGGKLTNSTGSRKDNSQSFFDRHPVVCSLAISFFVGFVLLFSFWKEIINAIEGLF